MSTAEPFSRLSEYHESVLYPMLRDKRFRELCDWIIAMLETAQNPEFRFALITDLSTFLRYAKDDTASYLWAEELTREFPDNPIAWTSLAGWYFYSPHPGSPSDVDMFKAFEHYKSALKIARQQDEFVRYVLFDICRVLTDMGDFAVLSEYMNEIIEDIDHQREIDIPQFEADWLNRVPKGAIDLDLRNIFVRLEAADLNRRQTKEFSITPPTRYDLEQDESA